jgi:hypothetical protein
LQRILTLLVVQQVIDLLVVDLQDLEIYRNERERERARERERLEHIETTRH